MKHDELLAGLQATEQQLTKAEQEIKRKLRHPATVIPIGVAAVAVAELLEQSSVASAIDGAQSATRAGIAV